MKHKRRLKINWEVFALVASVLVSIVAIIVGIAQANKSLDRADKQLELIKIESASRIEEGRPLLILSYNSVYKSDSGVQFRLGFKNIGTRPCLNLRVNSKSLFLIDSNFTKLNGFETTYSNAVNNDQIVEFVGNIDSFNIFKCFLVISIQYEDILQNKLYKENFYYEIREIINHTADQLALYGVDIDTKEKIETWFNQK